jgi:hypothetical protein
MRRCRFMSALLHCYKIRVLHRPIEPTPYNGQFISTNFFSGQPGFDHTPREYASIGYQFEHKFDHGLTVRQNPTLNGQCDRLRNYVAGRELSQSHSVRFARLE